MPDGQPPERSLHSGEILSPQGHLEDKQDRAENRMDAHTPSWRFNL